MPSSHQVAAGVTATAATTAVGERSLGRSSSSSNMGSVNNALVENGLDFRQTQMSASMSNNPIALATHGGMG